MIAKKLINDPSDVVAEAVAGVLLANPGKLRKVRRQEHALSGLSWQRYSW
jgi:dihydroxyacetone kinase